MDKLNSTLFYSFLLVFIVLQPILDILTNFSSQYISSSVTIGVAIRVLFMAFALLYIVFGNKSSYKKHAIIYLFSVFAIIIIGFIINIFMKPTFEFFMEAQWIAKTIYFPIMFCAFFLVFHDRENQKKTKLNLLAAVTISLSVLSLSIIAAILTNTASDTYEWTKLGYKGWFFSGNELSAIIAITFPLVYLYAISKTKTAKDVLFWIPAFGLAVIGALVGTKVGFFAVLASAGIFVVILLIHWIVQLSKNGAKNNYLLPFVFSIGFLILFAGIAPLTPSYFNLTEDFSQYSEPPPEDPSDTREEVTGEGNGEAGGETELEEEEEENLVQIDSRLLVMLLSSRNLFFTQQYNQFLNADLPQKLFGMGYAGNYTDTRKLIEMDLFDMFFSYGILGTLFLLMPLWIVLGLLLKSIFTNFKYVFLIENVALVTSIALGFGVAMIAGHVLFAPAVSIYLALSMVILLANLLVKHRDSDLS